MILINQKIGNKQKNEDLKKSSTKNSMIGGYKELQDDNQSHKSEKSNRSNMTIKTEAVSSIRSSDSSEEERSDELMMFLKSEGKTSVQNQEEKRNLIQILALNKQNEDEEEQV